ncbi:MAG: hypothetical protein GY767_12220 [Shimia sp.]|nr:hypothetical protein [Shimia sp.]MCP4818917.1 hypothetical protein [Shimia sp.]MCP4825417.1 hypothetical protein [Shimia sp.]
MPRSITLRPALYEFIVKEAALRDRTINAQALRWLAIGKAVETSGLYTQAELSSLLEHFDADSRPE